MKPTLASLAALLAVLTAAPAAGAATLPLSGTLDLGEATADQATTWSATESGALAGAAVAGIGDFDGDGRADMAVGEPKRDTPAGKDGGAVHVVFDPKAGGKVDDPATVLTIRGASALDQAGFSVHGAGDVNGDGLADLAIGAPNAGGSDPDRTDRSGAAYVVFGRPGRGEIDLAGDFGGLRITGAEPGARLGRAVSSIGDLNGDGLGEVLVSAPNRNAAGRTESGSVYVVFGRRTGGTVDVASLAATGAGQQLDGPDRGFAGRAISSIGDLNGDGRAELLVTAPRAGEGRRPKGTAYVVYGRADAHVADLAQLGLGGMTIGGSSTTAGGEPETNGDFLGESIEPVGDVNGDTLPDLVVGAHLADSEDRRNGGVAYVVFGKRDPGPVDLDELRDGGFRLIGVDQSDQTGFDVAPAGDFNGDGVNDIAVSSIFAQPLSRENAGAVYVVFGRRGNQPDLDLAETTDRALRIAGAAAGDTAGFSVDTLGDVNGDRGADLVVGATAIDPEYLTSGKSDKPGRAYVVFGAAGDATDDITDDPGVQEEQRRGCTVATNVQVLMEDNGYTDRSADPKRIRMTGMQAYVATPRNHGTVLGVTGFGSGQDAEAIFEPTLLGPKVTDELNAALAKGVDGEDSFPGYPFMARTFANDNPGSTARILLVDGYLFRAMRSYSGLTEGNPPTYVIAVGSPPDRNRRDIVQMRRLARETEGRYYEARTPRGIERALQNIESRLRCDLEAEDFHEEIEAGEPEEVADEPLDPGVHTADVRISWRDPAQGFEIARIDVIRGGQIVRRISGAAIARAYGAGQDAALQGGRGRTFRALHLRGMRSGGRLRVVVRAQSGKRDGRVYARVTQSRRRT